MIASLLLLLATAQEADRSSPEKTLETMARALSQLMPEMEKLAALRTSLDELGDDLCSPTEKLRRLENRRELQKKYPSPKLLGASFGKLTMPDVKADEIPVEALLTTRVELVDPASGQKRIQSKQEAMRFSFVKVESRWLIRGITESCKLCDGKGLCFACAGSGLDNGAPCPDCKGRKSCDACKGKKERDATVPRFYYAMVSDRKVELKPAFSTPEETTRSFAELVTKKALDESSAEIEAMRRFLSTYRLCLTPEVGKTADDAFAKAVAEGAERFKNRRPKVESLEKQENSASAVVRELVPPELEALRFKDHDHRIVLKKIQDCWLIDQDQMGCACQGKDPSCIGCKGSGWTNR